MKNIVILGAGFGGLRCAMELDRALSRDSSLRSRSVQNDQGGWRVVLVDRNAYQVYSPRLYDTAIPDDLRGGEEMEKSRIDILSVLKNTAIEFVQGEVKGVDCTNKKVEIAASSDRGRSPRNDIEYDYLVLALGAGTDYFGIPGLKENACTLKSLEDAERIREKVAIFLQKVRHPEESRDEGSRAMKHDEILRSAQNDKLEVMIGGAGATGVEVAAELAYLFRKVSRERWSITLVEALPRVLSMFPNALSQYAHTRLQKLGVKLMLDTCIKEVTPIARHPEVSAEGSSTTKNNGILRAAQNDSVKVEVVLAPRPLKPGENEKELVCDFLPEHEKRMRPDLLVWTGGVRANPLLDSCGMTVDRKGRLEVDEYLRVKGMEDVFAIGDNALLMDPATKQPIPGTAQAALLEGKIVASNIVRAVQGVPFVPYPFAKFPAIVPLAGHDAVALIGSRVIRGFPAWTLRKAADYHYYAIVVGWWRAIKLCFLR